MQYFLHRRSFRSEVLSFLPNLTILDGEILDEDKIDEEIKSEKGSLNNSINEHSDIGVNRKPRIVTAISLLLSELDCLDDVDEILKEVANRSKKIKTNADLFTV